MSKKNYLFKNIQRNFQETFCLCEFKIREIRGARSNNKIATTYNKALSEPIAIFILFVETTSVHSPIKITEGLIFVPNNIFTKWQTKRPQQDSVQGLWQKPLRSNCEKVATEMHHHQLAKKDKIKSIPFLFTSIGKDILDRLQWYEIRYRFLKANTGRTHPSSGVTVPNKD